MQERHVAARHNDRGHRAGQPGGEPSTAPGLVRAHRADLRPAFGVHPLPRHRHQLAVAADAQVGPELDRPRPERPRLRPPDQSEHLGDIGRAEPDGLRVFGRFQGLGHHLDPLAIDHQLPAVRRRRHHAGQRDEAARPHQVRGVRPVGIPGLVGKREERGHVGLVAQHVATAFRQMGVRPDQRATYRIVERLRHRPNSSNTDRNS